MWVYLEIEPDGLGLRIELVKWERLRRFEILYDATCRALSAASPHADGLVVPGSLPPEYKYDLCRLILQIRLETTSGLLHLPILVQFVDLEDYVRVSDSLGMNDSSLRDIGVFLVPPDQRLTDICPHPPKQEALRRYIQSNAARPQLTGRHSESNRWAPYVFFRVLELLEPSFATQRESIETRMFEEPYFKRLAGELRQEAVSKELLDRLGSTRHAFRKTLQSHKAGRKILVVEDRLDDGWREVYAALFDCTDPGTCVIWANTEDEARSAFEKDIGLVVLDVRLSPKDEVTTPSGDAVPAGVRLARWFREKWPPIPILAATASNKTWILEPLLKEGIQGYWVKESPEHSGNLVHAVGNVIELYRKARDILEWSDRTRPWIEGLRDIADQVCNTDIGQKANSLHALLDRAFSPFSQDLDNGLQRNVAFLILFSCINDLRDWCCRIQDKCDGGKDWIFVEELGKEVLVSYDTRDKKYRMEYKGTERSYDNFPDTNVFYEVLMRLGCTGEGLSFNELRKKRNAIPLTHGLAEAGSGSGERVGTVTDDEISEMLEVLQAVVEKRRSGKLRAE